tara:strand:+ start:818 stop:1075 length:258 start_codon:yes stop_codon:yes gene_type:complete
MSEHDLPRLFTPDILHRYMNANDELSLPVLKTIIKKQQDIIDKQGKRINTHDVEIEVLTTSLQEIRLILNGRQFMNRSLSFEYTE